MLVYNIDPKIAPFSFSQYLGILGCTSLVLLNASEVDTVLIFGRQS